MPSTTNDHRTTEVVAGLRDLADLLECNPDVTLPNEFGRVVPGCLSVFPADETSARFWVDVLADRAVLTDGTPNYPVRVRGRFGGLLISIYLRPGLALTYDPTPDLALVDWLQAVAR